MTFTEKEVQQIEHEIKGKETLEKLWKSWNEFYSSPYYETYITLYNQISDWNSQLTITEGKSKKKIINEGKDSEITINVVPGRIDLFSDKDSKEFDRAFKYFSDILSLLDALDRIREKLSPKQKADTDKVKRLTKNKGVAV